MLELKNIVKKYGNNVILDDISLQIKKGEIVSILGPSGSGKTTLLNLILGITDISSGKIIYDGEDITNVPLEKRGFNIVFQDYALFPNLTAYENIVYGLRNKPGISTEQDVQDFIHLLGLEEHLNKRISQLSGGQKQRVALARTMVMKPKILLLDEPLSALDGVIKESIKSKIKEIAREFSLTTIIVTHDPEEALTLSDKVLIINDGEIAQYGTPKEIIQQPADDFVEKGRRKISIVAFDSDNHVTHAERELVYNDYTSPVFSLDRPLRFSLNADDLTEGLSAEDCLDGTITDRIRISYEDEISSTPGLYHVTYSVANRAGDVTSLPVTVELYDPAEENGKPQITLSDYLIHLDLQQPFDPQAYLESVSVDQMLYEKREDGALHAASYEEELLGENQFSIDNPVDTGSAGVYEVTYTATAEDGQTSSVRLIVCVNE